MFVSSIIVTIVPSVSVPLPYCISIYQKPMLEGIIPLLRYKFTVRKTAMSSQKPVSNKYND